jgi:hypothetical protein
MNNMKLISMEKLFKLAGYNYLDLEENKFIDISNKNIFIKSFNHKTNKIEKNKILKLVRKENTIIYEVRTQNNTVLLKGSGGHRIFDPIRKKYIGLSEYTYGNILNKTNEVIPINIIKTDKINPVLDIEVENTKNYFSNGILSHNTTTGGNALKFYASYRIELSRVGKIKQGDAIIGDEVKAKFIKNKLAPPFQETKINLIYGDGFCKYYDTLNTAVELKVVHKGGSWYSFGEIKLGQGEKNVIKLLKDNNNLFEEILTKIKEKI